MKSGMYFECCCIGRYMVYATIYVGRYLISSDILRLDYNRRTTRTQLIQKKISRAHEIGVYGSVDKFPDSMYMFRKRLLVLNHICIAASILIIHIAIDMS